MTDKERLQFIFQLKILEALYPDEAQSYALNRKALENGYTLHYPDLETGLYPEMSEDQCREVLDVLEMYRGVIFSFKELVAPQELSEAKVKFPGFDGNNESYLMSYVSYFIEDLGRYHEIKELSNGYYNSHAIMLPKYQRMLRVWNALNSDQRYAMSEAKILELLST